MMQLESKTHISPLLTIELESPVAQWLEHPTRSQKVIGLNPIWDSNFSEFPVGSINISFHILTQVRRGGGGSVAQWLGRLP